MPLPMTRPISGRRFAPKIRMMIVRMIRSSGRPILPTAYLVLCGAVIVPRAAQEPRPQFASRVQLVEVYASVTNAAGKPVTGLTQRDFTVEEDGTQQEITTFAAGEFPLAVA